jgi:hypothetical protein
MNNQEAKFILGAYRPDGQDAADPAFAQALLQAAHDPELRAWLEQQRRFDTTLTSKLREISPPTGLRDAILAGTRISAAPARGPWWTHPAWLTAAAAIVVLAAVIVTRRTPNILPAVADFTAFAIRDLADAHAQHIGHPGALASAQSQFEKAALPLTKHFSIDLEDLRRKGCRTVRIAGHDVFEICFERDGTWYHLYAARRSDFAGQEVDPWSQLASRGEFAGTAWADTKNIYALVTGAGPEALRRLI